MHTCEFFYKKEIIISEDNDFPILLIVALVLVASFQSVWSVVDAT